MASEETVKRVKETLEQARQIVDDVFPEIWSEQFQDRAAYLIEHIFDALFALEAGPSRQILDQQPPLCPRCREGALKRMDFGDMEHPGRWQEQCLKCGYIDKEGAWPSKEEQKKWRSTEKSST